MIECLDEETILSFCRGGVEPRRRPEIEEHLGECDECRALVSAVARSSLVDPKELIGDPAMAPTTPAPWASGVSSASFARAPSGPASSPVRPGDLLAGKYSVERVLGMGGMGVVVAARHTQLDQRVALKFLLPAACEAPDAITRFLREGKAAARIASEHVARVVDTGVLDNGSPYLVMEYLEGSDLGAVTADRGPLPYEEAIDYVLQACEAIVEAHQLGIVHRDLKPANLFLARRKDGSPLVKVLDFGISKSSDGGSRSQLTSTSVLMGSPRYMSPEQMVSAKDVDARTDVWALGVILYELVTGKPVWHADTVQGLCALIASAPAPLLRQRAPSAPVILEEVVMRCLAKSQAERIQSVADLALALEPIAPASAHVSIDRILRVAGRVRGNNNNTRIAGTGLGLGLGVEQPRSPASSAVALAPAAVGSATSSSSSSSSRTVVVLLAGLVGALVIAGLALNIVPRVSRSGAISGEGEARSPSTASTATTTTIPPAATSESPTANANAPTPTPTPTPTTAITSTTSQPRAGQPHGTRPRTSTSISPAHSAHVLPDPTPTGASDGPNRALTDRK